MKGILMKPWKTKAIGESDTDRLWHTRRLDHLKEINLEPDNWELIRRDQMINISANTFVFHNKKARTDGEPIRAFIKPRYQVGEVVYIKEAFWEDSGDIYYKMDFPNFPNDMPTNMFFEKGKWKSPLSLPEIFARYFIRIKDVRAEFFRLSKLTPQDLALEGGNEALSILKNYDGKWLWVNSFVKVDR